MGLNVNFRFSIQPLTILGVTGPFSVLAENIYTLCDEVFKVDIISLALRLSVSYNTSLDPIPTIHGLVTYPRRLASLRTRYHQCP